MPGDSESISDTGLVFPLSSWYSYLKALVTRLALYHHQHPHIKTATPWGEQDRCYPHFTEWETISQATSPTSQDSRSWGWSKLRTANFFLFLNLHSQGSNFTGESKCFQFRSVQPLSHVRLLATPWIAACQASLSITNSQSLLKLMSIESVMPSSHLIFCSPRLLLPPIPPSIRVFSNESTLHMRWPKYFYTNIKACI